MVQCSGRHQDFDGRVQATCSASSWTRRASRCWRTGRDPRGTADGTGTSQVAISARYERWRLLPPAPPSTRTRRRSNSCRCSRSSSAMFVFGRMVELTPVLHRDGRRCIAVVATTAFEEQGNPRSIVAQPARMGRRPASASPKSRVPPGARRLVDGVSSMRGSFRRSADRHAARRRRLASPRHAVFDPGDRRSWHPGHLGKEDRGARRRWPRWRSWSRLLVNTARRPRRGSAGATRSPPSRPPRTAAAACGNLVAALLRR